MRTFPSVTHASITAATSTSTALYSPVVPLQSQRSRPRACFSSRSASQLLEIVSSNRASATKSFFPFINSANPATIRIDNSRIGIVASTLTTYKNAC
jgi:hypothetical protein